MEKIYSESGCEAKWAKEIGLLFSAIISKCLRGDVTGLRKLYGLLKIISKEVDKQEFMKIHEELNIEIEKERKIAEKLKEKHGEYFVS